MTLRGADCRHRYSWTSREASFSFCLTPPPLLSSVDETLERIVAIQSEVRSGSRTEKLNQ